MVAVAPTPTAREEAVNRLRIAAVQSSLHYPCIAEFEAFAKRTNKPLSITREFVSRAITLPLYPTMAEEHVNKVCKLIGETAAVGKL